MSQPYTTIEGFKCYSPKTAYENMDYPSDMSEKIARMEEKHFWFISRSNIINSLVQKFLPLDLEKTFLEIGCGNGYVLKRLSVLPNLKLIGAEIHIQALKNAQKRLPGIELIQFDAVNMPFKENYDSIGAFDVLEHIDEDERVMANIYKALKKKGLFFITVPQHKWLWSAQDDAGYHKRRYIRKEMVEKLTKAGFKIRFVSSFMFTLLPLMFLSRLRYKSNSDNAKAEYSYSEFQMSPFVNLILRWFLKIDEVFFRLGISLPIGGSLVVVAEK